MDANITRKKKAGILPEMVALTIILAVAAALRFWKYAAFSLSNDELSAINRLRFDSFNELVKGGFYVDGHPGGIQVFLWYWSRLFGNSAEVLRLPFVVFGILSVFISFLVARKMFGKVAGLFTAASLAFLQFPLLYSQIARPYGSGLLFSLSMTYFWLELIFPDEEKKGQKQGIFPWIGFLVSVVLCMYNHYFSFLFALVVGVSGLFLINRKKRVLYLASGIAAAVLFLPHLRITLNHLTYQGVGLWLGKPGLDWPLRHIEFLLDDSLLILLLFVSVSFLLSWKGRNLTGNPKMLALSIAWFLVPMAIGYFYSLAINPVLQNPVLIFSFPFGIMLFFISAGNKFGHFQQLLLAVFLATGVTATVVVNHYYSRQHFGEFRGIAATTLKWEKEIGKDSLVKVVISNSPYYLEYYFQELGQTAQFDMYNIKENQDMDIFLNLIRTTDKPYLLYATTKPETFKVEDLIRTVFPYVVKNIQFGNLSGITLYGKTPGKSRHSWLQLTKLVHEKMGFDHEDSLDLSTRTQNDTLCSPVNAAFIMPEAQEFSPAILKNLNAFGVNGPVHAEAKVNVRTEQLTTGALLVLSLDKNQKNLKWQATPFEPLLVKGRWTTFYVSMDLQGDDCIGSELKAYVWNKEKKSFRIDNLELNIWKYENYSPFAEDQQLRGNLN